MQENSNFIFIMMILWCHSMQLFANTIIDGGGNCLLLSADSVLTVSAGATVTLKNLILKNLSSSRIVMESPSSTLVLDNVKVCMDGNYTFTQGYLNFKNDVTFTGNSVFTFAGALASTISSASRLCFDIGTTFSYAPSLGIRTFLGFTDATSQLYLNGCTLISSYTGMVLRAGTLLLDNKVVISSSIGSTQSSCIAFGDSTAGVDLTTILLAGAQVVSTDLLDIK